MEQDLNISNLISGFLNDLTACLADFIESVSPSLHQDWWQHIVINKLTTAQRQRIEKENIKSLKELDLAILLRVLNSSWGEISYHGGVEQTRQHLVKEMQIIRNRWAHVSAKGYSTDDLYRDLDTLQRFAIETRADAEFIEKLKNAKKQIIIEEAESSASTPLESIEKKEIIEEFSVGQIVELNARPEVRGAITKIIRGDKENSFEVFVEGGVQTYFASQLSIAKENDDSIINLSCENFHAYLSALQIRHPGLSTLYSLNAARIEFVPYQFKPVLRFIRSDRPRLLIADSVGVGKTIEAGLILRELQARKDVRSVLIICPKPLVTENKWMNEMKRFEENFVHLNSRELNHCINETDSEGEWPSQYKRAIVPYSLFDEALLVGKGQKKGLLNLDPAPHFDLVIVDEAHHIRNSETYRHKAVQFFCDNSDAAVFLTATPIQLGNNDLFVLLKTLRPDLILDKESFENMSEPNPFINKAVSIMRQKSPNWQEKALEYIQKAENTDWGLSMFKGSPDFRKLRETMESQNIDDEKRIALINQTEETHTFSNIINRTRRRDIGDFTKRKPETVKIDFTHPQKDLHDSVLELQAEIFSHIHGNQYIKFMMSTIRRQTASSIYGLAPFLEGILTRNLDQLGIDTEEEDDAPVDWESISPIKEQIKIIIEKAKKLDEHDPKLEALRKIILDKQKQEKNKLILFSSFRHTLNYLYLTLIADGFRVGIMHGGTPDQERIEMRKRFEASAENPDSLDIMLFSEIGCEGLDYQFCDCMVNYDLPWNPMRIEQRIGRIDRKGQKSPSVLIYNLITPGTIDADIYERCLMRIGVFEQALGDSEEILGKITSEIKDIAESYQLTEIERKEKLQLLADNKIRDMQEQEKFEEKQKELFGIQLPEEQIKKDVDSATSFWLSPESLHRLTSLYLNERLEGTQEYISGKESLKKLRLSKENRDKMLEDYKKLAPRVGNIYREWENWLKGSEQQLNITFESEYACDNRNIAFIMPLHPLVKQAANHFDKKRKIYTKLLVHSDDIPKGRYEFAIYQWKFYGLKEDLLLQPIASDPVITKKLNELIANAADVSHDDKDIEVDEKSLEKAHYDLWRSKRKEHAQNTRESVGFRKQSLNSSQKSRMLMLKKQLEQVQNEKIQRMKKSEISNAENEYQKLMQELEIAAEKSDVVASIVAYGVIYVK